MKKYAIIIVFLFCTIVTYSQNKKDNVITIPNFNMHQDFPKFKLNLLLNGYEFNSIDTALGYFSTEFHPIEGSVYAYNLKVKIIGIVQEGSFVLKAFYTSQYSDLNGGKSDASGRASYETRKNISKRLAFDELIRICNLFCSELQYSRDDE